MNTLIIAHKGIGEEIAIEYISRKYNLKKVEAGNIFRNGKNPDSILKPRLLKILKKREKIPFNTLALGLIDQILSRPEQEVLLRISIGYLENINSFAELLEKYGVTFSRLISLKPHSDMLNGYCPQFRSWPKEYFSLENYKIINEDYLANKDEVQSGIENMEKILKARLLEFSIGRKGPTFGHDFDKIFSCLQRALTMPS